MKDEHQPGLSLIDGEPVFRLSVSSYNWAFDRFLRLQDTKKWQEPPVEDTESHKEWQARREEESARERAAEADVQRRTRLPGAADKLNNRAHQYYLNDKFKLSDETYGPNDPETSRYRARPKNLLKWSVTKGGKFHFGHREYEVLRLVQHDVSLGEPYGKLEVKQYISNEFVALLREEYVV